MRRLGDGQGMRKLGTQFKNAWTEPSSSHLVKHRSDRYTSNADSVGSFDYTTSTQLSMSSNVYLSSHSLLELMGTSPDYIQGMKEEDFSRVITILADLAMLGGGVATAILTCGASTPFLIVVSSSCSGALFAGAISGTAVTFSSDFTLSRWAGTVAESSLAGAIAGGVGAGAGVALGQAETLVAQVVKGALTGASASTASSVVTKVLAGKHIFDGIEEDLLQGLLGGGLGGGLAHQLGDQLGRLSTMLRQSATAGITGVGGHLVHSLFKGEHVDFFSALEAATSGILIAGFTGLVQVKLAREKAVEQMLSSPGCDMLRAEELAKSRSLRVEFVDKNGKPQVDQNGQPIVLNETGKGSIQLELQRNPSGGMGHVKRFGVKEPQLPGDDHFCFERAVLGGSSTKADAQTLRSELNEKIRPQVKNILGRTYEDFKKAELFGAQFDKKFLSRHVRQGQTAQELAETRFQNNEVHVNTTMDEASLNRVWTALQKAERSPWAHSHKPGEFVKFRLPIPEGITLTNTLPKNQYQGRAGQVQDHKWQKWIGLGARWTGEEFIVNHFDAELTWSRS